jgi:PAS domain S-box-containing protein
MSPSGSWRSSQARFSRPRLRLQGQVVVLALLALLVLALQAGLTVPIEQSGRDAEQRVAGLVRLQSDLQQLLIDMIDQETGIRGYTNTAEVIFLEPYDRGRTSQRALMTRLGRAAASVGLAGQFRTAASKVMAWQSWAEARRATIASTGEPNIDVAASNAGRRLFDAFRHAEGGLDAEAQRLLGASGADLESSHRALTLITAEGILLTACIVLILCWAVTWLAIRPIVRLSRWATGAAESQVAPLPANDRSDEVGDLSRALSSWQRSREEIDNLFVLSRDMFGMAGTDGYFKRVNPAWEAMLGWTKAELLAVPYLDLVHPDDRARTIEQASQLAEGVEAVAFENRYRCKDGSYRALIWHASAVADGLTYCVARDMTESRAIEDSVRQQAKLIELAHDAVIVRALEGQAITYWSRGATDTYGYGQEEARGRAPSELLKTRYPAPLAAIESELLGTGGWEGELTQTRKDGSEITVSARWAPESDGSGNVTGVLEVNRDITSRKRSERKVQVLMAQQMETVRRLQLLDEAKTQFVSTASHELRTPLTSIMGFTELLVAGDGGPLSEDQRGMVAAIDRNGKRLLGLVEDLLSLARIESGRNELHLAPTNVGGLAEAVVEGSRMAAAARGVRLTVEISRDIPLVAADRSQIDRALTNLVSNAVKFTPADGQVRVSAASRRDAEGTWLEIQVTDTGIGIPKEEQEHLFEQFFRSTTAQRQAIPGTGLGLSIVKGIVEQHRGRISIESEPGSGTCVTVTLPAGTT